MPESRWLSLVGIGLLLIAMGGLTLSRRTALSQAEHQADRTSERVASPCRIICEGQVEPEDGEVDLSAQIPGVLLEVRVREGSRVNAGDVLAILDAPREKVQVALSRAALEVARARLARTLAGPGIEEIDEVVHLEQAEKVAHDHARKELARLTRLRDQGAVSHEVWEEKAYHVASLSERVQSLRKRYEALQRGALPEEIELARTEVASALESHDQARILHDYRLLRAPFAGQVLHLYRHPGDSVRLEFPSPILRLASVERLRIRIDVPEDDVDYLCVGMDGSFRAKGSPKSEQPLTISEIVPRFGPKRLFDPDTTARVDRRVVQVLCKILGKERRYYPGQRITASFTCASLPP